MLDLCWALIYPDTNFRYGLQTQDLLCQRNFKHWKLLNIQSTRKWGIYMQFWKCIQPTQQILMGVCVKKYINILKLWNYLTIDLINPSSFDLQPSLVTSWLRLVSFSACFLNFLSTNLISTQWQFFPWWRPSRIDLHELRLSIVTNVGKWRDIRVSHHQVSVTHKIRSGATGWTCIGSKKWLFLSITPLLKQC